MIQVRQGFGQRKASLVDREGTPEDDPRDFVRRPGSGFDGGTHHVEAPGMVGGDLPYPSLQVVEDRTVSGEDEGHVETAQFVQGFEVPA